MKRVSTMSKSAEQLGALTNAIQPWIHAASEAAKAMSEAQRNVAELMKQFQLSIPKFPRISIPQEWLDEMGRAIRESPRSLEKMLAHGWFFPVDRSTLAEINNAAA